MSTTSVEWVRETSNNRWPDLTTLNLEDPRFDEAQGVFIVFHGGEQPGIVCVGEGRLREQLKTVAHDARVLAFEKSHLYVAWAKAKEDERLGIEKYLSQRLMPKVSGESADVEPISVNLPWKKTS